MAGKRGQTSLKPSEVPQQFAPGYLRGMDLRKPVPRAAVATMQGLADAIGGEPSPQQQLLIEHGTWAHLRLRQMQSNYLESGELDYRQFSALLNSLVGCLRSIGLERRAKPAKRLHEVIEQKNAEEAQAVV